MNFFMGCGLLAFDIESQKWYYNGAGARSPSRKGVKEMEKTVKMENALKWNDSMVSFLPDGNIAVMFCGRGCVCSEYHFDGWAVEMDGIWLFKSDDNKWRFKRANDDDFWMVLDEDEVSFEDEDELG